jgi:hypothetical protein
VLAPNAEQIEGAVDSLKSIDARIHDEQLRKLEEAMGQSTLEKLGSTYPLTADLKIGYQIGLQTARQVMAQSAVLAIEHVNPDDVL